MAGLYEDQISGAKQRLETARRLRESSFGQYPQGQFIGNYYAAPHWTNHLANALRQIQLGNQEQEATQELQDVSRKQAQDTIRSMNAAGIPASENMLRQAQEPEKIPGFIDRASAFLRGKEAPQPVPAQPFQQNIAKDLTPEQRDAAYIQLLSTNPELGKSIMDYQKMQSESDSKSMRRARMGVPQGFDINENGELIPMPVAGGGNYLNTVLPMQAQARGSYMSPSQQANLDISQAHLGLAQQNAALQQQKEQRQEAASNLAQQQKQWEMQNPNAQTNIKAIEDARSANEKLQDTLKSYKSKLESTSEMDIINPLKNSDLQTAHQAATWPIRSETMMNTGVLNPGEMGMLNKALTDPTSIRGAAVGKKQLVKQIDEMLRISDENTKAIIKSRKPATPPGMENSPYWQNLGGEAPKPQGGSSVDDLLKKYGGQ